jgi:RNA polymerase sigma-70 factor, ECF subfamily
VTIGPEFRDFYAREGPAVFKTVFLLCGDRAVAEDATQEAFARALERWSRLRGQPWIGGWATQTAINVAKRSLRRRPVSHDPASATMDQDAAIDLWREVARLPLRQQQAVILHYREDRPVHEIARAMGCREGTVRTHLARARAALRERVEGEVHANSR